MKNLLPALFLAAFVSVTTAAVRQWTVAGKAVEGELTAINGERITIKKKRGGTVVVPLVSLEQVDRDFVAAEVKVRAEKAALAEKAARLRKSEMAKAVAGYTCKLDGKKLKSCDVFTARAPEYYLLYWGGSWCTPSREAAPQFAKEYDEVFSKAKNIEAVLLSCDDTREKMQEFMTDMKLNFPAITRERWQNVKLLKGLEPAQLPAWKLVDASGTVIAEGDAAKARAREQAGAGPGPGDTAASPEKK